MLEPFLLFFFDYWCASPTVGQPVERSSFRRNSQTGEQTEGPTLFFFFGSQDGQSVNRSSIQAMSTSRVFGQDCPNNQTGEHPNVKQTNRRTILRFSMPMGTGAFYSFIFAQNDCKEWFVTIQYLMNLFDVVPQIRLALFRSYFLIQTTQGSQKKNTQNKTQKRGSTAAQNPRRLHKESHIPCKYDSLMLYIDITY